MPPITSASPHPDLVRIDHATPVAAPVVLIAKVRDEALRLPYFLGYYRRLGVRQFIFIANASRDSSIPLLLAEPDCIVYSTEASFAAANSGIAWINAVADAWARDRWVLLVDPDELLVWPDPRITTLPELADRLAWHGHQGLFTTMVDLYALSPLRTVTYRPGEPFLDHADYFDGDYIWRDRPGIPLLAPAWPPREPVGGPRIRLCYPEALLLAARRQRQHIAIAHALRRAGLPVAIPKYSAPPLQFKVPLVHWRSGARFLNCHRTQPIALPAMTGALLHFKFFQDFSARVEAAIGHGQYYNGSAEYHHYARLLAANPNLSLAYAGSRRYSSPDDLLAAGIVQPPRWPK